MQLSGLNHSLCTGSSAPVEVTHAKCQGENCLFCTPVWVISMRQMSTAGGECQEHERVSAGVGFIKQLNVLFCFAVFDAAVKRHMVDN